MGVPSPYSLASEQLDITVPGRSLVSGLSFGVAAGELLAVLGQNGSGKSLTLHTLAGLRPADNGEVMLNGARLATSNRKAIARQLALLPQHTEDIFPSTVIETVLIGRHPHVGRFGWESDEDREIARRALRAVDLDGLADRDLATLSGGERRRVAIAQVLTQATAVCLLDEPGNHLDPQHQLHVMRLFRAQADAGHTVVASLHDVNLAARFADRCLLLYGDGRWLLDDTEAALSPSNLSELYATRMEAVSWHGGKLFVAAADSGHERSGLS